MDGSQEDRLEEDIRRALRPQSPRDDFASHLLTRLALQTRPEPTSQSWWRFPGLRWAAAAVLCMVVFAGGTKYVQQRRQAEGEAARRQVIVALRIAGTKIQLAQSKVQHLSQ